MVGAPPASVEALTRQLRDLGVPAGVPLMVHASLRAVGPVAGGADGLIDAIELAIGPAGTMLMVLGAPDGEPFDRLTSPAQPDVGTLAEVFRRRPEVSVNDHPAGRFAAAGPQAAALLEPAPLHDYYGSGSVLERFTAMGGWVLRLGADPDTVTLTHHAEYLADVPDKRRARTRYLRADTGEVWVESLDDSEGIKEWPRGDYFVDLLAEFLATGRARVGWVGGARAELFAASDYVPFAAAWMERNLGGGPG